MSKRSRATACDDLVFTEMLMTDPDSNSAFVLAAAPDGAKTVVLLRKTPFKDDEAKAIIESSSTGLEEVQQNDEYSKYRVQPEAALNEITMDVIRPATEWHIAKYSQQTRFVVRETPEIYSSVTVPYVSAIPEKRISWVYNILEGKKEQELVVHQDEQYVLLPDSKWDRKDMASMYVLAIVKQRDLRSLRDLRAEHLPLLRHIKTATLEAIKAAYGVEANTVRAYVHYLPSFWHLHVHFNVISCPRMGGSLYAGKAILLDDMIDNLTMNGDYYAQCSLTFTVGEREELYPKLMEAGAI